MDVLQRFGWASHLSVPTFWDHSFTPLDDTFLWNSGVYPFIVFCIGVVLLFSKERGRRSSRLDWTRRWGIICSYVVALLWAAFMLFVPALVLAGISAMFMNIPLKYQPSVTQLFIELSTRYLRYGPYPKNNAYCVQVIFSSVTILLACVPLWEALRSSGLKGFARIILAPLALFALMNIAQAGTILFGISSLSRTDPFELLGTYFRPALLLWNDKYIAFWAPQWAIKEFVIECVKWFIIFAIAVWLSIAQLTARRKNISGS